MKNKKISFSNKLSLKYKSTDYIDIITSDLYNIDSRSPEDIIIALIPRDIKLAPCLTTI